MSQKGCKLARFDAEDGLQIDGLLAMAGTRTTIVHVHGKCGNFYQNEFISYMAEIYPDAGINFLSFNHRGHDCLAEGYRHGKVIYLGGSIEVFTETVFDIRAAIRFVSGFSDRIILQSHSNGCEKVLYFAISTNANHELILLSPSDSYQMQAQYIAPETVEAQITRLLANYNLEGWEWLGPDEYGIRVPGKEYFIPVTAKSLITLLEGPAFEILRYDRKWQREPLPTRLFTYIGGSDPYITLPLEELKAQLNSRVADVQIGYFPEGDHHFHGMEYEVINLIINWVHTGLI
jgi:hypothetical protein